MLYGCEAGIGNSIKQAQKLYHSAIRTLLVVRHRTPIDVFLLGSGHVYPGSSVLCLRGSTNRSTRAPGLALPTRNAFGDLCFDTVDSLFQDEASELCSYVYQCLGVFRNLFVNYCDYLSSFTVLNCYSIFCVYSGLAILRQ